MTRKNALAGILAIGLGAIALTLVDIQPRQDGERLEGPHDGGISAGQHAVHVNKAPS